MLRTSALVALLAFLAVAPRAANAGATTSYAPYCTTASWGGECFGQLSSFLSSPDPTALAQFSFSGDNGSFYAVLGGQDYACSLPANSPFLNTIAQASVMPSSNYFFIWWDTTGTCQSVQVSNSSRLR